MVTKKCFQGHSWFEENKSETLSQRSSSLPDPSVTLRLITIFTKQDYKFSNKTVFSMNPISTDERPEAQIIFYSICRL